MIFLGQKRREDQKKPQRARGSQGDKENQQGPGEKTRRTQEDQRNGKDERSQDTKEKTEGTKNGGKMLP